ncbi:MAG: uracil-DNA glycosylase [Paramuribaculum sp.]|nr:uracil-DNA glycosylase [Paramuribaculum sp.]
MDVRIEQGWKKALAEEWDKNYFLQLTHFVKKEYAHKQIFPPGNKIFAAFDSCPYDRVRVVIIGQDPYHDIGQANGLCFSVNPGVALPRSLVNIFKEIQDDIGAPMPPNGDLSRWAEQGVLLLNATLTVEAHKAGSHQGKGWEEFTDAVIRKLADEKEGLVFVLWGAYAGRKGEYIDSKKHLVLKSAHPSPLSASRGFFGNHHFSLINDYLIRKGEQPIVW